MSKTSMHTVSVCRIVSFMSGGLQFVAWDGVVSQWHASLLKDQQEEQEIQLEQHMWKDIHFSVWQQNKQMNYRKINKTLAHP